MVMPLSASMKTFSQSAVFSERLAFSWAISSLCMAAASSAFFGSLLIPSVVPLPFVPQAIIPAASTSARLSRTSLPTLTYQRSPAMAVFSTLPVRNDAPDASAWVWKVFSSSGPLISGRPR